MLAGLTVAFRWKTGLFGSILLSAGFFLERRLLGVFK